MKLYHASPCPPSSTILTPNTRNISIERFGEEIRAYATEYSDDNTPYLYASSDMELAATYAITKGLRLCNSDAYQGGQILIVDQESRIGDPDLNGRLYAFDADNFTQVFYKSGEEPTSQWVSDQPANLLKAECLEISSLNDLMRMGIQVYQIADAPLYDTDRFYDETSGIDHDRFLAAIRCMSETGQLRWLNQEREINPLNVVTKLTHNMNFDAQLLKQKPAL